MLFQRRIVSIGVIQIFIAWCACNNFCTDTTLCDFISRSTIRISESRFSCSDRTLLIMEITLQMSNFPIIKLFAEYGNGAFIDIVAIDITVFFGVFTHSLVHNGKGDVCSVHNPL